MLSVFEQPWGGGLPVRSLPAGVSIAIRFANGDAASVDVLEVNPDWAVVQTSNKSKWRMIRIDPSQLPIPPADTGGAPTTHWIVKEEIIPLKTDPLGWSSNAHLGVIQFRMYHGSKRVECEVTHLALKTLATEDGRESEAIEELFKRYRPQVEELARDKFENNYLTGGVVRVTDSDVPAKAT